MKEHSKTLTLMLSSIMCIFLTNYVQSMYFYMEKGQEKCFKDEVVKNYVS